MLPLCRAEGVGVIPWSPLARGRLARPWQSETTKRSETDRFGNTMYAKTEDADQQVVEALTVLAKKRGGSQASLALGWMLAKPGITAPIVGATKPHQREAAVAALSVTLTGEEMAGLEAAYVPHPVLGF